MSGEVTSRCARVVRDHVDRFELPHTVCVGLSGGADSLALTHAAVAAGLAVHCLVIDHGLQHDSEMVAGRAAEQARAMGASAKVIPVSVTGGGGMEAAARSARYAALDAHRAGWPVMLGHTRDDQAETVLLGLGRGSGSRSIAGMVAWNQPWSRPFLSVDRSETVAVCATARIQPWNDPHNTDSRFTRVRLRQEVLPLLDDVLDGGVVRALSRTADQLRDDLDALDRIAVQALSDAAVSDALNTSALVDLHRAVRTRVLRQWLQQIGARETNAVLIAAVDDVAMRGRGEVAVGGDSGHRLCVRVDEGRLRTVERQR